MKTYHITYKTNKNTQFTDKIEAIDKYDAIQVAKFKSVAYNLILVSVSESSEYKFNSITIV